MRADQRPPTVGIVACVCYLVLIFAPYVAFSAREVSGLETYYSYGIAGPQFLSLLVVVAIVLFAAGRENRSDPDFVAGLTIVLGAVFAILVVTWAVAVPEEVVASLGTAAWLEYHRWFATGASFAVVASAAWYARALSLV